MLSNAPRVLFVHNGHTSFVRLDLDCLCAAFSVTECYLPSRWVNPLQIWRQVADHDMVFGWFASWHTFLPMLFARLQRKPSSLVVGGYDLANLPEASYGHQRGGLKKWVSRWTMRLAGQLITNSFYSREEAERNAGIAREKVHVVYHGVPDPFGELPEKPSEPLVLTVGNVSQENLLRKGHELFVHAAAFLPGLPFVLAGRRCDDAMEHLRRVAPPTVRFTGWVSQDTLLDYYRRASVYVQASLHEGFGMSLAEAMLAGCVPVVTRNGALPEVVGEQGVYAASQSPEDLAQAIRGALEASETARQRCRQHILDNFPMENRRQSLVQLARELLSKAH